MPFVTWLEAQLDDADPIGSPGEATMLHFRLETAKTTVRFIDGMLDEASRRAPAKRSQGRKR